MGASVPAGRQRHITVYGLRRKKVDTAKLTSALIQLAEHLEEHPLEDED